MSMDDKTIETIAYQLIQAQDNSEPITPLTESFHSLNIEDAYRIQFCLRGIKIKRGEHPIGWKVGATSRAIIEQLSIYEPILGHLLNSSIYSPESQVIPWEGFIKPGIEPEIAFRIEREIKGPGVDHLMVSEAIEWVLPAIEIVDCRIKNWKIKIQDAIADNSLHRGILVSSCGTPFRRLNLADEKVTVEINDQTAAIGEGKDVLGNPVNVVVWLANKLAEFGMSLNPGDIIMTGSVTHFLMVQRGYKVKVSYDRLGSLEFSFR
ncbi:MAG: fumarylacetoacetate hydrolase family protein [Proteobacteria bacterium]|nr:fumarylacetoacetate hydrolase family protein [Pseudomonadota bacterium]